MERNMKRSDELLFEELSNTIKTLGSRLDDAGVTIKLSMTPKGEFKSGTIYTLGDVVSYKGSSYGALGETKDLPNNSSQWKILAQKGEQGDAGYTPVKGKDYTDGKDGYTPIKGKDYQDGVDGKDGREVELRTDEFSLQWKYTDESSWHTIFDLEKLKGEKGEDGKEVELRQQANRIEWRREGEKWKPLVSLDELKGKDGDKGEIVYRGGGGIKYVAGDNITIEKNTDGQYVISSTGGGGGSSEWGDITGDIEDQTDLQDALAEKATQADIAAAIAALVDSSPTTLDTLNELAAALGDDPNFATTIMNALALKADLTAIANMVTTTGAQNITGTKTFTAPLATADPTVSLGLATKQYVDSNRVRVIRNISQTAHGLVVGDVVYVNSAGAYIKGNASRDIVGIIQAVADANTFTLMTHGWLNGLSGLTAGDTYYAHPTTAGALTNTKPTTIGQVIRPLLVASGSSAGYFSPTMGKLIQDKGFVNHGSTASTPRPDGYASIEWYGSVEPNNMANGDTWVQT